MVLKAPRSFARAHSAGALDSHDLAIQGELHRARYQGGSDLLASAPESGRGLLRMPSDGLEHRRARRANDKESLNARVLRGISLTVASMAYDCPRDSDLGSAPPDGLGDKKPAGQTYWVATRRQSERLASMTATQMHFDLDLGVEAGREKSDLRDGLIALGERKGVVYTKPWVVDLILDLTGYRAEGDLAGRYVVEPSAGEGAFLGPMVRRLLASITAHGRQLSDARSALHAYELDKRSATEAFALITAELTAWGATHSEAQRIADGWVTVAVTFRHPGQIVKLTSLLATLRTSATTTCLNEPSPSTRGSIRRWWDGVISTLASSRLVFASWLRAARSHSSALTAGCVRPTALNFVGSFPGCSESKSSSRCTTLRPSRMKLLRIRQ